MSYQLFPDKDGEPSDTILRLSDNACIPKSADNADYQEYLEWLAEGNTPTPADS